LGYSLEIAFMPANELAFSLYTYLCKKAHKRIDLGPAWAKKVSNQLNKTFIKKLADCNLLADLEKIHILIKACPKADTTTHFLTWFEQLSIGEMFEHFSPWIKEYPKDLGLMRDQLVYFLSEWDQQYFCSLGSDLIDVLERESKYFYELAPKMDASELVEFATNGLVFDPQPSMSALWLIPQIHYQPLTVVHAFGGLVIAQYAAREVPIKDEEEPPIHVIRVARSLGDKTRLKILKFISTGPKSFIEIVKHLGMAKSTIFEHLLILRASGLIKAHLQGSNPQFYSIRIDSIPAMQKDLLKFFAQE
jgi:DNA-binding transcriptional ArsR family regulator